MSKENKPANNGDEFMSYKQVTSKSTALLAIDAELEYKKAMNILAKALLMKFIYKGEIFTGDVENDIYNAIKELLKKEPSFVNSVISNYCLAKEEEEK